MFHLAWLTTAFLTALLLTLAPKAAEEKKEPVENKNTLITKHKDKLKLTASTAFDGWPVEKLVDGDSGTSWFSNSGDTTTKGTTPYVEVEFPEDVAIARVTLLGNREADYPKGFAILVGNLELFDKDGKRLHKEEGEGVGDQKDFNFPLKKAIAGVRKVRFTATKDEGNQNGYDDVALAEIQIE